jgi:hypothetical protein
VRRRTQEHEVWPSAPTARGPRSASSASPPRPTSPGSQQADWQAPALILVANSKAPLRIACARGGRVNQEMTGHALAWHRGTLQIGGAQHAGILDTLPPQADARERGVLGGASAYQCWGSFSSVGPPGGSKSRTLRAGGCPASSASSPSPKSPAPGPGLPLLEGDSRPLGARISGSSIA